MVGADESTTAMEEVRILDENGRFLVLPDENSGSLTERVKIHQEMWKEVSDRVELRIITEKRQSAENGLKFSVELENKIAEPLSFITRTIEKDLLRDNRPKEKDIPFRFSIYDTKDAHKPGTFPPRPNLAREYRSNMDEMHLGEYVRNMTIDGNSTTQLDSLIFLEYIIGYKQREDRTIQFIEERIVPGTYLIEVQLIGYVVDNFKYENGKMFTTIFAEPVEVVLE
jgi:hypothetical protein